MDNVHFILEETKELQAYKDSSGEAQEHYEAMRSKMVMQFSQAADERIKMIGEYEKYKIESKNAMAQVSLDLQKTRAMLDESQAKTTESQLALNTAMIMGQKTKAENEKFRAQEQSYEEQLAKVTASQR